MGDDDDSIGIDILLCKESSKILPIDVVYENIFLRTKLLTTKPKDRIEPLCWNDIQETTVLTTTSWLTAATTATTH